MKSNPCSRRLLLEGMEPKIEDCRSVGGKADLKEWKQSSFNLKGILFPLFDLLLAILSFEC
jgi:hypothetical protein